MKETGLIGNINSFKRKALTPPIKEELVTDDMGVVTVDVVAKEESKKIKVI